MEYRKRLHWKSYHGGAMLCAKGKRRTAMTIIAIVAIVCLGLLAGVAVTDGVTAQ
jgi:hypothetical protein